MLLFTTPGQLDLNAIRMMGVSAKPNSSNPIGFFGTGMKYAIAGILRLGGTITLWTCGQSFEFSLETLDFRDAQFQRVKMNSESLGFSTELGKTWEPWMFCRELYCNTVDEKGSTEKLNSWTPDFISPDETYFVVDCKPVEEAFDRIAHWYLPARKEKPLDLSLNHAQAYPKTDNSLYYKGVKVSVHSGSAMFDWNILDGLTLTEDRSLNGTQLYSAKHECGRSVCYWTNADAIEKVVTAPRGTYEADFDYDWHHITPTQAFIQTVAQCRRKLKRVNASALKMAMRHSEGDFLPEPVPLTDLQTKKLDKALKFLRGVGCTLNAEDITFVNEADYALHGCVTGDRIFITATAFDKGTKELALTCYEEWLHKEKKLDDFSRELQNYLFEKVGTLLEELAGEPI